MGQFQDTLCLSRNESSYKFFHMNIHLNCMKMNLYKKLFSYGWFSMKTRCDTEARANSKMAYLRTKTHEILPAWFYSTLRYGRFHYSDAVLIFQLQVFTSVSMTKNSARSQLASSYLCSFAWSVFSSVRIFSSFLRTDWSSLLFKLRVSSNLKEKKFVTVSMKATCIEKQCCND